MNQDIVKVLFALIRSAICGDSLSTEEKSLYTADLLPQLIIIARKHDTAHLVVLGLMNNKLLDENCKSIKDEIFRAVYRYEQINHELVNLCGAFEKAQIPFIPLKGSVIRKFYPEPWMRTSCDIDIFIHEDDMTKAISYLENTYQYKCGARNSHDVSMFTPSGKHIELHYDLLENGRVNNSSDILKRVWETASAHNHYAYWYEMPDELFYFYHIAHMAKHFNNGGCGIRTFIDLRILDGIEGADMKKRDYLLEQGGLLLFAESARKLSRIWFSGEEYDDTSRQMEEYILSGGVYGTIENRIAVQQQKKGGRLNYALSKIFISYEEIKFNYPILEKHRWLTPFMEVRRWCKLLLFGVTKKSITELKLNNAITKEQQSLTNDLLEKLGLNK